MHIRATVEFEGKGNFAFPTDHGFGLIALNNETCLVEFDCRDEATRPQGKRVADASIPLILSNGTLHYKSEPVVLGIAVE